MDVGAVGSAGGPGVAGGSGMMRLEVRPQPSRLMSLASPLLALAITVAIGVLLFILLGKAFSDTMLDLMGQENKVMEPRLNKFEPPVPGAERE